MAEKDRTLNSIDRWFAHLWFTMVLLAATAAQVMVHLRWLTAFYHLVWGGQ